MVNASHLTAVAAKDNFSVPVEVRVRQPYAQWRYRLDVIVDGRPIYFDRYPQKIQHFQASPHKVSCDQYDFYLGCDIHLSMKMSLIFLKVKRAIHPHFFVKWASKL